MPMWGTPVQPQPGREQLHLAAVEFSLLLWKQATLLVGSVAAQELRASDNAFHLKLCGGLVRLLCV